MMCSREPRGWTRVAGWSALALVTVLTAAWAAVGESGKESTGGVMSEIARVAQLKPEDAKDAEKRMAALTANVTEGVLRAVAPDGMVVECPLKHTDVKADVTGFIARVKVTQTFYNPLAEKIEAVYVFPLPHKSAVDDMTMVVGERRVVGIIKRRAEARSIYEQALAQGATAALLEQERPNIFTQSVGNIAPQQTINIEISYVDVLEYDMGTYEFHFPMIVGPRYIPGGATSTVPPVPKELEGKVGELDKTKVVEGTDKPKGDGWSPDTNRVPDASRITPPVLKPGFRNGHDVSLFVKIDAGVPIRDLKVANHKADVKVTGRSTATAEILPADSIPNKDFVLRYAVVGEKPEMALLSHTDAGGLGTFMLMVQPKEDEKFKQMPPRELVFLIDVSGSMSGAPTQKNIEAVTKFLKLCRPVDTVQVITFESQAYKLFEKPVPVTEENIAKALKFTDVIRGGGGTEMLKGIRMALDEPADPERVRIVVMLTDGYIGNEAEIIAEVGKRAGDRIRFWCIGIGSAPNRFLTDGVARQGGGMSKVLGLNDDATPVVEEAMARITRAQLSKVRIDWGGMRVFETYPAQVPELWAGRPVIVYGLYEGGGRVTVRVSGVVEGQPASWPVTVDFAAREPAHEVLAKVWARNKIEDLMQQTYYQGSPEVEDAVTSIALEYRLMSQYTSFVAVDEATLAKTTEPAKPPRRMLVPLPIPEGTRYEGFFGPEGEPRDADGTLALAARYNAVNESLRSWSGSVRFSAKAMSAPAPAPMAMGGGGGDGLAGKSRFLPASDYPARVGFRKDGASYSSGLKFETRTSVRGREWDDYEYAPRGAARTVGGAYTYRALLEGAAKQSERAKQMLQAEAAVKVDDLLAARNRATCAWFLATAANDDATAAKALAAVESANAELLKAWTKDVPKLDSRLNILLRDRSLAEALAEMAKAAGIEVKLLDGSVEDAAAVTGRREARVTYLDLRGATVVQALDWLLTPERMTWWVDKGSVVAGTCQRGEGTSPWVYDVSVIAIPEEKEFEAIKDHNERMKAAKKSADEFLDAARQALALKDDAVAWYGPGQLVIFADAATHAKAAKFFADLADSKAAVPATAAELQKITSTRAEAAKDAMAKSQAASERAHVVSTMREFSWRLLSAAAGGDVDLEAITELQIAWRNPVAAELVKDAKSVTAMRSAWAICEAQRAIGLRDGAGVGELGQLAQAVRDAVKTSADDALASLAKSPDDPAAFLRGLYAALTLQGDIAAKAAPLLAAGKADVPVAPLRPVAAALLAPADKIDAKALAATVEKGVGGDDAVALTALACRRAGGDAWDAFRARSKDLLGDQPLDGSVVVLVSRLARTGLPIVVAGR